MCHQNINHQLIYQKGGQTSLKRAPRRLNLFRVSEITRVNDNRTIDIDIDRRTLPIRETIRRSFFNVQCAPVSLGLVEGELTSTCTRSVTINVMCSCQSTYMNILSQFPTSSWQTSPSNSQLEEAPRYIRLSSFLSSH